METTPDPGLEMATIPMSEFLDDSLMPLMSQPERDCWREGLPTLASALCTVREVTPADAPSLYTNLCTEAVARFIPPPPSSVEAFGDFVRWAHLRRAQGRYACFGIVPAGHSAAAGVIQVHVPCDDSPVADWGFALGRAFWGTGIFPAAAEQVRHFIFARMGVRRLEARSVVQNRRGNGALRKMGATRAGMLKGGFEKRGVQFDQTLWIIAGDDS